METNIIKPSRIFYGVSVFILIIGIVLFAFLLVNGIHSIIDTIDTRFVIPGSEVIELKEPGDYVIFYEYRSVVNGKHYNTAKEPSNGLTCSLKDINTGEFIKLSSPTNYNYSAFGYSGISLYKFSIDKPGKYELQGSYSSGGEEAVLAIGKGFGVALVRTIILCFVVFFISVMASSIIFTGTFVKRKRCKAMSQKMA